MNATLALPITNALPRSAGTESVCLTVTLISASRRRNVKLVRLILSVNRVSAGAESAPMDLTQALANASSLSVLVARPISTVPQSFARIVSASLTRLSPVPSASRRRSVTPAQRTMNANRANAGEANARMEAMIV